MLLERCDTNLAFLRENHVGEEAGRTCGLRQLVSNAMSALHSTVLKTSIA